MVKPILQIGYTAKSAANAINAELTIVLNAAGEDPDVKAAVKRMAAQAEWLAQAALVALKKTA